MNGKLANIIKPVLLMSLLSGVSQGAPTTTPPISATRWKSPCHPPDSAVERVVLDQTSNVSDQRIVRIAKTHIYEIQRFISNLTSKYENGRIHVSVAAMDLASLLQVLSLNWFPSISELRESSQVPIRQNLTQHFLEDFEILSVMAVYVEQAIKDEEDIQEHQPLWKKIEEKILTILCNFQKALSKYQQTIVEHVSHEILDDCVNGTPNISCRNMRTEADRYNRDYLILRIVSTIFDILKEKYESIHENIINL